MDIPKKDDKGPNEPKYHKDLSKDKDKDEIT